MGGAERRVARKGERIYPGGGPGEWGFSTNQRVLINPKYPERFYKFNKSGQLVVIFWHSGTG